MEIIAIIITVINLILTIFLIIRFRWNKYEEATTKRLKNEVSQLIKELNRVTERNVTIVEDRIKHYNSIIKSSSGETNIMKKKNIIETENLSKTKNLPQNSQNKNYEEIINKEKSKENLSFIENIDKENEGEFLDYFKNFYQKTSHKTYNLYSKKNDSK